LQVSNAGFGNRASTETRGRKPPDEVGDEGILAVEFFLSKRPGFLPEGTATLAAFSRN
jgi:hypothetical protein